jgi:hypothetical protein
MLFALWSVLESAQPEYKQNFEDMMRPITDALSPLLRLVKGNGAADDAEL